MTIGRTTIGRIIPVVCGLLFIAAGTAFGQTSHDIILIKKLGQADARDRQYAADLNDPAKRTAMLKDLLSGYDKQFDESSRSLAAQKQQAVKAKYVADLQAKAMDVIAREDLTKQMVIDDLDPIFAELEQLLMPSRSDAMANNDDLRNLRRKLQRAQVSDTQINQIEKRWLTRTLAKDAEQIKVLTTNMEYYDSKQITEGEYLGIAEMNRRRMILGLAPLVFDLNLVAAARDHCNDMITLDFFAHTSPVPGKTTPWDRAKRFGTTASGENIAAGYSTGPAAVMGWWYSPGHLKNMMGQRHTRVGLGNKDKHWTQMFGR